jgi:beta-lactamase regulating signal transducer with metallopeptidase domain
MRIELKQGDWCRTPFAFGIFHPIVVFPADSTEWSNERARVVLRHELVHVKQKDYAIKLFARSTCSLFWFVPFVWIAYANLCAEQEQACDALPLKAARTQRDTRGRLYKSPAPCVRGCWRRLYFPGDRTSIFYEKELSASWSPKEVRR